MTNIKLNNQQAEFERIKNMATYAHSIGLQVNAGHGLTLENTGAIAQLIFAQLAQY
jgi:pyridoxine 5-phosphate synthase